MRCMVLSLKRWMDATIHNPRIRGFLGYELRIQTKVFLPSKVSSIRQDTILAVKSGTNKAVIWGTGQIC